MRLDGFLEREKKMLIVNGPIQKILGRGKMHLNLSYSLHERALNKLILTVYVANYDMVIMEKFTQC